MTVRTVLNQTVLTQQREVVSQTNEMFPAADDGYVVGENNPNILSFDDEAGADWFYKSYDHIPFGSSQAGTQPI